MRGDHLVFMDSFQFMSSILYKLVSVLVLVSVSNLPEEAFYYPSLQ